MLTSYEKIASKIGQLDEAVRKEIEETVGYLKNCVKSLNSNVYYETRIDEFVVDIQKEVLKESTASSFKSSWYRTVSSTSTISSYREFGGNAFLNGNYLTTIDNATRSEISVLPEWNTMRFQAEIEIPQGTSLNIGKVEAYPHPPAIATYLGGADQILLPNNWDYSKWVKKIIDKETGIVYTFEEFKIAYPEIISKPK